MNFIKNQKICTDVFGFNLSLSYLKFLVMFEVIYSSYNVFIKITKLTEEIKIQIVRLKLLVMTKTLLFNDNFA